MLSETEKWTLLRNRTPVPTGVWEWRKLVVYIYTVSGRLFPDPVTLLEFVQVWTGVPTQSRYEIEFLVLIQYSILFPVFHLSQRDWRVWNVKSYLLVYSEKECWGSLCVCVCVWTLKVSRFLRQTLSDSFLQVRWGEGPYWWRVAPFVGTGY